MYPDFRNENSYILDSRSSKFIALYFYMKLLIELSQNQGFTLVLPTQDGRNVIKLNLTDLYSIQWACYKSGYYAYWAVWITSKL